MPSFVCLELLSSTKASRTYVDTVFRLANAVGAFDTNRMRQITHAAVTFDLQTGLVHNCYY